MLSCAGTILGRINIPKGYVAAITKNNGKIKINFIKL